MTKCVTACKNYSTRARVRLSRSKLTSFAGGWVFGDFLGDFLDLHDLTVLLIQVYNAAYPHFWPWIVGLFPAVAALFRSVFPWG